MDLYVKLLTKQQNREEMAFPHTPSMRGFHQRRCQAAWLGKLDHWLVWVAGKFIYMSKPRERE
jgi:hypothetical protein